MGLFLIKLLLYVICHFWEEDRKRAQCKEVLECRLELEMHMDVIFVQWRDKSSCMWTNKHKRLGFGATGHYDNNTHASAHFLEMNHHHNNGIIIWHASLGKKTEMLICFSKSHLIELYRIVYNLIEVRKSGMDQIQWSVQRGSILHSQSNGKTNDRQQFLLHWGTQWRLSGHILPDSTGKHSALSCAIIYSSDVSELEIWLRSWRGDRRAKTNS